MTIFGESWANNLQTTLAVAALAGDTTIQVGALPAGVTAPSGVNFRILVDQGAYSEYMLVTGVSGSTWTVVRGLETSFPVPHPVGAQVIGIVTAGGLQVATSQVPSIANPAAISTVDALGILPSGAAIFVQSLATRFVLDRSSTATADSVNYIAATGGGNWVSARTVPSSKSLTLAQGGSLSVPLLEFPFLFQPRDPTRGPFGLAMAGSLFNSTIDPTIVFGYNPNQFGSEPQAVLGIEADYEVNPGVHTMEMYASFANHDGSNNVRPIFITWDRAGGPTKVIASYTNGTGGGSFTVQGGAAGAQTVQAQFTDGNLGFTPTGYAISGLNGLSLSTTSGTLTVQSGGQLNLFAHAGQLMFLAADSIAIAQASTAQHATIDNNVSGTRFYPTTTNTGWLGLSANTWSQIWATTFDVGTTGLHTPPGAGISIAAGGTFTLNASQYAPGYIVLTGSLAGNATVVLPATSGAKWIIDATGVTLNAHTITLQANGVNWATTIGVTNLYEVTYGGAGKLYGTALTP